jgi:hypothetical protein
MVQVNSKGERVWDLSNPAEKAEFDKLKLAEKQNDGLNLKVSVSSQEIENLIEQKKAIESERDQFKTQLETVKQSAFAEKKRQLGAPDSITTPEQLQGYEQALKINNPAPSGQASLMGQYAQPQKTGTYANPESMISDLLTKERYSQDRAEKAQSKAVLDEMTIKIVKGAKEGQIKGFDFPKDESILDKLNDSYRKKILAQRSD